MGNKDNDRLKQGFLLAFIVIGILLIGLTWTDNLRGPDTDQPGYVRPSLSRMTPGVSDGTSIESALPTTGAGQQTGPSGDRSTSVPVEPPQAIPTIVDEDQ